MRWKDHIRTLALLAAAATVILFPFLSGQRPFVLLGDQIYQYNSFYIAWERMLDDFFTRHIWPFYSFSSFLGNNWYASKAYYVTGDFLMPLVALFPDVLTGLLWIEGWLLIILAGYFFWLYLHVFEAGSERVMTIAALLYAFSGTASIFMGQYMFMRAYTLTPLVLLAVENYRKKGKLAPLVLINALQFFNFYYFAFMVSLFLLLYVPFTYSFHGVPVKNAAFRKSFFTMVSGYLAGVLLAGILLVPAALDILHNPRVGARGSVSFLFDLKVYIALLTGGSTMPVDLTSLWPYPFQVGELGHQTFFSFYCGSAVIPVVYSLFFGDRQDFRIRAMRNLELALLPVLVFPWLSSLMHGLSEPSFRWTFLLVLVHLLFFTYLFSHVKQYGKQLSSGWKLYMAVLAGASAIGLAAGILDVHKHSFHLFLIAIGAGLLLLYRGLLKRGWIRGVLVLSAVECLVSSAGYCYTHNVNYDFYTPSLDAKIFKYLQDTDSQKFYRICVENEDLQPVSPMHLNESLRCNYRGISAYDTTYAGTLSAFFEWIGQPGNLKSIADPEVLRMLGTEYWCVKDEKSLPEGYSFDYVLNNNEYEVYRLKNCRPLAFTYSHLRPVSSLEFDEGGRAVIDWNNELIVSDEDYAAWHGLVVPGEESSGIVTGYAEDNDLEITVDLSQTRVLFLSIPYDKGWTLQDNGVTLSTVPVQGGFTGVLLEAGSHTLRMHFMPQGLKAGAFCSLAGAAALGVILFLDHRRRVK